MKIYGVYGIANINGNNKNYFASSGQNFLVFLSEDEAAIWRNSTVPNWYVAQISDGDQMLYKISNSNYDLRILNLENNAVTLVNGILTPFINIINTWPKYHAVNKAYYGQNYIVSSSGKPYAYTTESARNSYLAFLKQESPSTDYTPIALWEGKRIKLREAAGLSINFDPANIQSANFCVSGTGYTACNITPIDLAAASIVPPDGFVYLAAEGQTKVFDRTVDVAYGVSGNFVFKNNVEGSVPFTNQYFGSDPAPGNTKYGFWKAISHPVEPKDPAGTTTQNIIENIKKYLPYIGIAAIVIIVLYILYKIFKR